MKIIVLVLATLLIISSLFFSFNNVLSEEFFLHKVAQQSSEIKPSYDLFTQASKSMISVDAGENKTATIILDYNRGLTFATVGLSTIIKPQAEIANKIDSNLLNLTDLLAKDYILNNQTNIIVSFSDDNTIGEMADQSAKQGLFSRIERTYVSSQTYSNMLFFAARLNYSAVFELAESTNVIHVWLDREFKACLNQSVRIIKDPVTWATIESSFGRSINGTGVRIAVIDTGIDSTHPDFYFPSGTSKIVGAASFTGESTADGYGHGTHCASIAAGTGAASGGQYVGVAPGATLLNAKVLDNVRGEGQESWIISGIQWSVDNNANILSMSFGTDVGGDGTDPLSTTVNWAVDRGVVCAVAAGNAGSEMYTIASPGAAERAITVGASSKSDIVASFSSRGPTSDQRTKPDVVAPGVDIVAARATGTSLGTPISQYYTKLSGTSMATPHVAGAAALLLDAHPSWDPARVKRSLTNYANDTSSNVFEQGSGRIDVCKTANASIIGNYSLTFGRVSLNSAYKQVLDFQNLAVPTLSVSINVQVWHIPDKTPYQVASLNTSILTLAHNDDKKVELSLDTLGTLPYGYFEGRIFATFGAETIHAPFFFLITPQLNVKVTEETGSTVSAAFILIDASTHTTKGYLDERQQAQFVMPPGNYIVQAMDIYLLNPSGGMDKRSSFIVHQSFSAGTDETINLQLSLASAHKLELRSTDTEGNPISLTQKLLLTPYYTMHYLADMGVLANQYIYVTNLSEYMSAPCYFGYAGLSQNDLNWAQANILTSEVDAYFIGWDLSKIGAPFPNGLNFDNSELATFTIATTLPGYSSASSIWFNQIAGMWQTLLWRGFQTHPGITWRAHVLPYQYKTNPSSSWANNEWSCIYVMSTRPDQAPEYYVIDRHFQPITKGENLSYTVGKTPLLPQDVYDSPPYYDNPPIGLCIPYYPLRIEKNLFLAKTDAQATKRLEVFKNGHLISNQTMKWAQDPVQISQFLQGYGLYSFIVKTATSLNWSSQNTAEYIISYTSTSIDLIPPSITEIDCEPCFTKNDQQVEIQLADNDGISNVSLFYSTDNGPYLPSNLNNLGNNSFSADLALPAGAQKLSLIIEASDRNGNKIQFTTDPAATRGYETRIDASLTGGTITGKLTVIGGSLLQPVYLKVKSNGQTMYTLTDANGNFAFSLPPSFGFQIDIEMSPLGTYGGSSWIMNFLVVQTEPAGITSIPGGGWYVQTTNIVLTAPGSLNVSSNTRYRFSYWDVDGASQGSGINPITVSMNVNHTATAHYTTQYSTLFTQAGLSSDATGAIVTVIGNAKSLGDLPFALWAEGGSSVTYFYNDVVLSTIVGKRSKQVSVAGPSSPITVTGPVMVTGNYKTQYYLTVRTDPLGIAAIPGEGWYDGVASVTLTAPIVQNYQFNYWDIDSSPQGSQVNPVIVSMNAAHLATAYYASTQPQHDIAIANVTALKNIVGQGFSTRMNVTATNRGDYSETLNITVYANATSIASENVTLASGARTTLTFTWITTSFAKGNYTLSAYAWPVLGETNMANNNLTGGWVLVAMVGDVTGPGGLPDGKCDARDVALVATLYGVKYPSPRYQPNADIVYDGKIDAKDMALVASRYGKKDP